MESPRAFDIASADIKWTGSWYTSIIETVTYGSTFIVTILTARRASHKKRLTKARDTMISEQGFRSNEENIEMETTYNPGAGRRYMPVSVESHQV